MTDVQVSNARRIGFTALALVTFWVLAWQAYKDGVESIVPSHYVALITGTPRPGIPASRLAFVTVSYSILPVLFLSFAAHNSLLSAGRSTLIVVTSLLVAGTVASSFIVGVGDLHEMGERWQQATAPIRQHLNQLRIGSPSTVSWFLLLTPIILTTAFVIVGAWKSAVRDAEVEAVEEDE